MEEANNKKNIEIKVQFEYLNNNDVHELSREYKVKISLDDNTDFETNKKKILSQSNFKTINVRNRYHMFDKAKRKFFIKNSDFENYIYTKSNIVLIDCYEYCEKIIEKLKEELIYMYNNKNFNEIKKKPLLFDLICLENNFEVDIIADEFINKNGMEILLSIIKANRGELRKYSLKGISKLFSFEKAFDFFTKDEKNLNALYQAFIGNNEIEIVLPFCDIIIKLIGGNEEKTMNLITMLDPYFYEKMIKFLDEDNKYNDNKNYILLFFNMILNYSNQNKQFELISQITNAGIFENLDKIVKNDEEFFSEQIELFGNTFKRILEEDNSNNNEHKEIIKKYNNFIENKKIYHIQNLIVKANSENEEVKEESINELKTLLTEKNNDLDLIYEAFLKNGNEEKINSFYNFFSLLFKEEKNIFSKFLNSAKKYAENKKLKPLNEIVMILTNTKSKNLQLKIDTFSFINKVLAILLEFSNDEDYFEFLYILDENKFFEFLEKNQFEKEEKLNQLYIAFKEILEKNSSLLEKNKEEKYQILKNKFEKLNKNKIINEISELLLKFHNKEKDSQVNKLIDLIKDENNFKIFYEMFVINEIKNLYFSFFEIFAEFCKDNDNLIIRFIKISDECESEIKINGFGIIVNCLEENQNELVQIKALNLVNTLLSAKDKKISMEILNKFNKFGIFDYLNILIQLNDKGKEIKDQIKKYSSLVDKILNENKNDINYSSINKKNNYFKEIEDIFFNTLDDFIIVEK